jgi:hypothetical protein
MKRLINPNQVCEFLKIAVTPAIEPHIDTAHALVASAILTRSLDRRDVTETHKLKYDSELLELRDGPIAVVDSITVNGTALDLDDVIVGNWTIQYPDGFSKGDVIEVEYRAGFSKPQNSDDPAIPDAIIRALILGSAQLYSTPNTDVVYEKIGDYTKQTAAGVPGRQEGTAALDPRTLSLVQEFKRPRL